MTVKKIMAGGISTELNSENERLRLRVAELEKENNLYKKGGAIAQQNQQLCFLMNKIKRLEINSENDLSQLSKAKTENAQLTAERDRLRGALEILSKMASKGACENCELECYDQDYENCLNLHAELAIKALMPQPEQEKSCENCSHNNDDIYDASMN